LRKGAKHALSKVEGGAKECEGQKKRNSEFETNLNDQKTHNSKHAHFGIRIYGLSLSVCFGFRASDFGFCCRLGLGTGFLFQALEKAVIDKFRQL